MFRGIRPAVVDTWQGTWAELASEHLPSLVAKRFPAPVDDSDAAWSEAKKRQHGFVLAEVDGRRHDDNTREHTALAIDVDKVPGNDLGAFRERCSRYTSVVYETASSTDEAPRARVVVALAAPIKPGDVSAARLALAEDLGLDASQSGVAGALPTSQVMFAGRVKGTRERGLWTYDGELWAPPAEAPRKARAKVLAPAVRADVRTNSTSGSVAERRKACDGKTYPAKRDGSAPASGAFDFHGVPDLSSVAKAVPPAGLDGDRHLLVRGLGGWLARRGYSPSAIAEAVRLQIPSSDPAARAAQAQDAAERARQGLDAPGWEALSSWAERYGKRTTLPALERACRDPREPEAFGDVWSEWWAGYWPRFAEKLSYRARGERATAIVRRENAAALASVAQGLDGLETDDNGAPIGTVDNIIRCVRHLFGHALGLDTATGQAVLTEAVRLSGNHEKDDVFEIGPWQDIYTVMLQAALNRMQMRHAYSGDTHNAVKVVASARPIDVHGDWLRALAEVWDGAARVDDALSAYWRAADDDLSRAVSRIMFLGIAARGLRPGCQLDTVPVFIGAQGCGKSQSLQALVWGDKRETPAVLGYGAERRYCGSKLQIGHKDALAVLRGHLVWELPELASVKRADVDEFKAYVTQRSDTFRPSHERGEVRYPRTVAFVASVNPEEGGHVIVNRDATGGRRWAPVCVAPGYVTKDTSTHHLGVDIRAIERDRDQLLGEAAARVLGGEQWHPTQAEAELLAPAVEAVTEDSVHDDPWFQPIKVWAKRQKKPFGIADVLGDALNIEEGRQSRTDSVRVGKILRGLKYGSSKVHGVQRWQ